MRACLRLLAAVQKGAVHLEPGAPTGLTGLLTAPAPRTTLIHLYSTTLTKLKELPESSVYRQSTEALTKHRLNIVESTKPAGLEEWQERVKHVVDQYPETYLRIPSLESQNIKSSQKDLRNDTNIAWRLQAQTQTQFGATSDEYGKRTPKRKGYIEGPYPEEAPNREAELAKSPFGENVVPAIEPEPSLTAEQIGELEAKIGAGLIEEVIAVAEGELDLVHTMAEARVWEDLEERPVEGQWTYFERDAHTKNTEKR